MYPRPCLKEFPTSHYDHPWCGTPMLVTHPIDQMLVLVFEIQGWIFAMKHFVVAMIVCLFCTMQSQSGSDTWR
jgi:hypothetical protein